MLLIDKETMKSLRERVLLGQDPARCQDELKKVIEIKSSPDESGRAEAAYDCVGRALPAHLAWELKELEEALWALEEGKRQEAAAKLGELINIMDC